MDPILPAVAAVPLIGLGAIYVVAYRYFRRRDGVERIAARWALLVSWLSFLGWTVDLLREIVLSTNSTAFLGIIEIPLIGIPLAVIVLAVAWAILVVILSFHRRYWRERQHKPSILFASAVILVTVLLSASHVYSVRLRRIAESETSAEALRSLSEHWWARHDGAVLNELARNAHTPPEVLTALASSGDSQIRYGVARNPSTSPPVLEKLYDDPYNRTSLAVNPTVPPAILHKLATDADDVVRGNLLFNPKLPVDILEDLTKDPAVGKGAEAALRHRREGPMWFIMAPPYTSNVSQPFTRVLDDHAPMEQWRQTPYHFETQEACEALREELVRREANPRRIEAIKKGGRTGGDYQPFDFYAHTRCAYVEK